MLLVNEIFHFIYNHCTAKDNKNQRRFVESVRDLLTNTTLRARTIDELWTLSWDKPIWANQPARSGSEVVARCTVAGTFARYNKTPSFTPENVKLLKGLRDPNEKLLRINRLAAEFERVYQDYVSALQSIQAIANKVGYPLTSFNTSNPEVRKIVGAPSPIQGISNRLYWRLNQIKGFGVATALHAMVDYGFPVCKPDLWIIRLTQAYTELGEADPMDSLFSSVRTQCPNFDITLLSQKYIEAHPEFTFAVMDYLVANHVDVDDPFLKESGISLDINFNAHRFADLMVAKFGMSAEENMGIMVPPSQLLDRHNKTRDQALITKYQRLSDLATHAEENRRNDGDRKPLHNPRRFVIKPNLKKYHLHPPIIAYRAALTSILAQRNFDHVIEELQKRKVSLVEIEHRMARTPPNRFSETVF